MTMTMTLNHEQIVEALERCSRFGEHPHNCDGCPLLRSLDFRNRKYCRAFLARYALALIRKLTEENEKLEDNLIKQSTENIMLLIEKQGIRADTVRKMQERLKEHLEEPEFPWDRFTVSEEVIDQIAKEMLEEKDDD